MKKSLLIVASLLIGAYTSNAQIINPNFATWTDDEASPTVKDPNAGAGFSGWWDFNFLNESPFLGGSTPAVTPDSTTTYNGAKYSAKITTVALTSTSAGIVSKYGVKDTMGLMFTGNISVAGTAISVKTGEPWGNRLTQFSFYYQYAPNGVDSASCAVVVSHFSGGKRNTLGAGIVKIFSTVSSWTLGTVNITYDSAVGLPDTIFVEFSSSSQLSKPKVGSTLLVDGISTVDGVNEVSATPASVSVYPNPATNAVHFTITGNDIANYINVFDMTGKKITTLDAHNNIAILNSSELASGLYFYQLYNKAGNLMKTGKFSISK